METPRRPESTEKMPHLDALVVLGAVMEWNAEKKKWEFPTVIERYPGKLVMGKARALATRELQDAASVILVTGGKETHPESGHIASRARELARTIVEDLGVADEKIIPIGTDEASHTLGNVENVVRYIKQHPELLTTRRIGILSPRFQLERAQAFFEQESFFAENDITIDWLVVEDILGKKSPHYQRWEKKVYESPAADVARASESKGLEDFKSGTYTPKDIK